MDIGKLREELLLNLERERSDQVFSLRAKQKQVATSRTNSMGKLSGKIKS